MCSSISSARQCVIGKGAFCKSDVLILDRLYAGLSAVQVPGCPRVVTHTSRVSRLWAAAGSRDGLRNAYRAHLLHQRKATYPPGRPCRAKPTAVLARRVHVNQLLLLILRCEGFHSERDFATASWRNVLQPASPKRCFMQLQRNFICSRIQFVAMQCSKRTTLTLAFHSLSTPILSPLLCLKTCSISSLICTSVYPTHQPNERSPLMFICTLFARRDRPDRHEAGMRRGRVRGLHRHGEQRGGRWPAAAPLSERLPVSPVRRGRHARGHSGGCVRLASSWSLEPSAPLLGCQFPLESHDVLDSATDVRQSEPCRIPPM